ncbi:helix-turn-helix domain-containing protein [Paenibacillus sp. GCM10012307]|uniref:Helix-turn-helix domain-containing protein n=1 Tax=Paenibacillus roseus TaxID=2798579 RepID=A0A934MR99_9BACL|nr:helix-turn-helix transcriptional regulator [Paenibacillus roseus]MBJ6362139.1 helix-turn-helix domain-containing protein [Paenibacillus roseus]
MVSLGARLKKAREQKRLTQMEVAQNLGISNGTLSGYERNYRDPDTNTLARLATLYGVSVDWLAGAKTEKKDLSNEEMILSLLDEAGEPNSSERRGFTARFLKEFDKLPDDVQQNLYDLVKSMPKK